MGGWHYRGVEWNERGKLVVEMKDGTLIVATTEDCDGDMAYWTVKEGCVRDPLTNKPAGGSIVATGEVTGSEIDDGKMLCELVINYGVEEAGKRDRRVLLGAQKAILERERENATTT